MGEKGSVQALSGHQLFGSEQSQDAQLGLCVVRVDSCDCGGMRRGGGWMGRVKDTAEDLQSRVTDNKGNHTENNHECHHLTSVSTNPLD